MSAGILVRRRDEERQIIQTYRAAQAKEFIQQLADLVREADQEPPTAPSG